MKFFKVFLILYGLISGQLLYSQDTPEEEFSQKEVAVKVKKHHGFVGNPLIFYTPETRLALGISTIFYFRTAKKDSLYRPSITHPFIGYTLNKQFFVECPFQLFFKQEKYYVFGELSYYNYPYRFFGVGNNQPNDAELLYEATYPTCSLSVLKKVAPKLYVGIRYNFDSYKITFAEKDSSNPLYNQSFSGKTGGVNNGIGLQLLYDSRDNIFASTSGWYVGFISIFDSRKLTFSDYNYQKYILDVRKYISNKKGHVLAFQYYTSLMGGDPPFYQMSLLGGDIRMRGYYEGRFRDKNYTTTQVEYRSPFWKNRLGFAIFGGAGLVFPDFQDLDFNNLKQSIGAGLRGRFNRKEKIHFRVDVAYGNSLNYYFVLSEAF